MGISFYSSLILLYYLTRISSSSTPFRHHYPYLPSVPEQFFQFFFFFKKEKKKRVHHPGISTEHGLTIYNKTGHKPSYQGWIRQPSRRKRALSTGKRVRDTLHSHCWESYKYTKLHNHKIYAKDLAQTLYAFLSRFSLCEPLRAMLIDSVVFGEAA